MNETKQYPNSTVLNSAIQTDLWNSKFQVLADSLLHHIREEEQDERHESKGVYIDFQQLK
jgi:hypothetical protein